MFLGDTTSEKAKAAYVPIKDSARGGKITLGSQTSAMLELDPKSLGFLIAKHKFVGKMMEGFPIVLEIGCSDGFGSRIVAPFVQHLCSIDYYWPHVKEAMKTKIENISVHGMDFLDERLTSDFDGIFALDVLEHVDPAQEPRFLQRVISCLKPHGVFIVGMPSLESQAYASEYNKAAHINCQSESQLKATLKAYFANVFSFGFNDEVLHAGFGPMRQYLMMVCTGPKK